MEPVTLQDLADAWRSMRLLDDIEATRAYARLYYKECSDEVYAQWFQMSSAERDKLGFHTS